MGEDSIEKVNNKKEIGKVLPGPSKLRPSDVIAIPLPKAGFGFARCYKDSLGVFDITALKIFTLPELKVVPIVAFLEYYEPYDVSPWIYLGKMPFGSSEVPWGPAVYLEDTLSPGAYDIMEHGKIRSAARREIKGLNRHILLDPQSISDFIQEVIYGKSMEYRVRNVLEQITLTRSKPSAVK